MIATKKAVHVRRWCVGAQLLALLTLACSSLGPRNVVPDQFDYNQAIGQASNEQMLLNLVRLRYSDVPVFLAVSSVLTQYIYSGNAGLNGTVGTSLGDPANSLGANTGVLYIERPTITYSPLSGEEFAKQVMTPIPAELVFSLLQSGWPAVDLMTMGVERLGDRRNPLSRLLLSEQGRQQHREFREAAELLLYVAQRDGLEMLRDPGAPLLGERYLVFRRSEDPETAQLIADLKTSLGLDPEGWRFLVTRSVIERGENEVTFRVRSLLDLMGYLSSGVEIPQGHWGRHIDDQSEQTVREATELMPLRIRSGPELPDAVFVSVRYLDHYFWIAADDARSKASFGLLTYLFLMMATTPAGSAPLITVPAG